jgi:hypothetical protein
MRAWRWPNVAEGIALVLMGVICGALLDVVDFLWRHWLEWGELGPATRLMIVATVMWNWGRRWERWIRP